MRWVRNFFLLMKIEEARDNLTRAEKMTCYCDGFTLQRDGCQCGRATVVRMARKELNLLVEELS